MEEEWGNEGKEVEEGREGGGGGRGGGRGGGGGGGGGRGLDGKLPVSCARGAVFLDVHFNDNLQHADHIMKSISSHNISIGWIYPKHM